MTPGQGPRAGSIGLGGQGGPMARPGSLHPTSNGTEAAR
jgi:hypothetical protein